MEKFWEETAVLGYRDMVDVFNKMDPTWWKDQLATYGLTEEDFAKEAPEYLITAIPSEGYDPDKFQIPSCSASSTVEHGDVIDLGDRAFEVIHMPGHSEGAIGLWEQKTGIFFSGDIVYDTVFIDFLPESDKETYVNRAKSYWIFRFAWFIVGIPLVLDGIASRATKRLHCVYRGRSALDHGEIG